MTGILSARIGSLIPSVLVVNYCACSIASLPNDLASNFDMASDGVIADASLGIPCQYCCSAPKNGGCINATLPFAGSYPVSVTVEESTNRIFVVTSDQTMSQVSVVAISGSTNRITDTINLGSGPFF